MKLIEKTEGPEHKMLIMDYKEGLELSDIPDFIKSIEKFVEMVKRDYKNEKVKLFFLPEDLAKGLLETSEKGVNNERND